MNAPMAESEKYLRNPRREELGNFTIRTSHFPPARGRATIRFRLFPHVKRVFSPCATGRHPYVRRRPGSGRISDRPPTETRGDGSRRSSLVRPDPKKGDRALGRDLAELPAGGRVDHPDGAVDRKRVEATAVLAQRNAGDDAVNKEEATQREIGGVDERNAAVGGEVELPRVLRDRGARGPLGRRRGRWQPGDRRGATDVERGRVDDGDQAERSVHGIERLS